MKSNKWAPFAGWLAAAGAALALAVATPTQEPGVGKVPQIAAKRLDQRQLHLPQELPAGRTLALVVFRNDQRPEVQSWIEGLRLKEGGIQWLKLPVLSDPGSEALRTAIEQRLLARYTTAADRERMVPVFTDRDAFVRSVGLSGHEHASVLVVDRTGNVLARVEGPFDEGKAQALRETILAQND